jgi:hypothetical protein
LSASAANVVPEFFAGAAKHVADKTNAANIDPIFNVFIFVIPFKKTGYFVSKL